MYIIERQNTKDKIQNTKTKYKNKRQKTKLLIMVCIMEYICVFY